MPAAMDVDSVPDNTSACTSGSGDALRLAWNTSGLGLGLWRGWGANAKHDARMDCRLCVDWVVVVL